MLQEHPVLDLVNYIGDVRILFNAVADGGPLGA